MLGELSFPAHHAWKQAHVVRRFAVKRFRAMRLFFPLTRGVAVVVTIASLQILRSICEVAQTWAR